MESIVAAYNNSCVDMSLCRNEKRSKRRLYLCQQMKQYEAHKLNDFISPLGRNQSEEAQRPAQWSRIMRRRN